MVNLYNILELNKTCTQEDIKKAYRRLVLVTHPDKCTLPNAHEKFIDIQNAYEILSSPDKRREYDELNDWEQAELYNKLKFMIKKSIPNIEHFIKIFFGDEDKIKQYINDVNLVGLYGEIMNGLSHIKIPETTNQNKPHSITLSKQDLDINGIITTNICEVYAGKYRKIKVNRQTCPELIVSVPLDNPVFIIKDEGEIGYINDILTRGDIILSIQVDNQTDFIQIDNDIYYSRHISLYDYLYGGSFRINYLDGTELEIKFGSFIENVPLITMDNLGMIIPNTDQGSRGKLIITLGIKDINKMEEDIKLISGKTY